MKYYFWWIFIFEAEHIQQKFQLRIASVKYCFFIHSENLKFNAAGHQKQFESFVSMTQPQYISTVLFVSTRENDKRNEEKKIACNQEQNGVYHNIQLIETAKHLSLVIINNWKRWKCAHEKENDND